MSSRVYFEQAIALFGSEKKLGHVVGYSQNAIWRAKTLGRAPALMALRIEKVAREHHGVQIPSTELCPDLRPELLRPDGTFPPANSNGGR